MSRAIICLLMTASAAMVGCSTTHLADHDPISVRQSPRSRAVVVECLMNRLGDSQLRVRQTEQPAATVVTVHTILGNPVWHITVRDQGSGSTGELRRVAGTTPGRTNAESCF